MSSTKSPSRGSRRWPPCFSLGKCPIMERPETREGWQRQRGPSGSHNDQSRLAASDPRRPGGSGRPHVAWQVPLRLRLDRSPLLSLARTCQESVLLNGYGWRGWGWQWARLCATATVVATGGRGRLTEGAAGTWQAGSPPWPPSNRDVLSETGTPKVQISGPPTRA